MHVQVIFKMNTRASNSYEFLKGGGKHSRQTKENVVDWILSGDALVNIKGILLRY